MTREESLGWTAFEEAQEPSDAMTIIGAPPRETRNVSSWSRSPDRSRRCNRKRTRTTPNRRSRSFRPLPRWTTSPLRTKSGAGGGAADDDSGDTSDEFGQPSHVRVLPPSDPWDEGFDEPVAAGAEELAGEPEEETEEPLLVDEQARRRFRRR